MTILRLLPVFLSSLLIAAHFKRADMIAIALVCIATPTILFTKKFWAVRVVQVFLIISSLEWIRTTINLVQLRIEHDQDWKRLAVILITVALFTGCSSLIFKKSTVKELFQN